jgi:hypothetical protein
MLQVRKIAPRVLEQFHEAAGVRGMNTAEYFTALVHLHERLRSVLDSRKDDPRVVDDIRDIFDDLNLGSKTR